MIIYKTEASYQSYSCKGLFLIDHRKTKKKLLCVNTDVRT